MPANWPKKFKTSRVSFNTDNIKEMIGGIEGLEGVTLEVGILKGKAVNPAHTGYDDVEQVAIQHEYGATKSIGAGKVIVIPQRSFLRSTLKEAAKNIIPLMQLDILAFVFKKKKLYPPAAKIKDLSLIHI